MPQSSERRRRPKRHLPRRACGGGCCWRAGCAARPPARSATSAAARALLEATLRDAEARDVPQIAQRCHTSLGLLAAATGDPAAAEASFKRAVALIETMRAPLPADEFRTAFVADKLTPYTELARLCLAEQRRQPNRRGAGLCRARARRARWWICSAARCAAPEQPRDPFEARMLARLDELREELNWFYSQINRPPDGEAPRSAAAMAALHDGGRASARPRSRRSRRQIQQRKPDGATDGRSPLAPGGSRSISRSSSSDLGPETALVEYFSLDGELLAFIVTDERVEVVRGLAREEQVEAGAGAVPLSDRRAALWHRPAARAPRSAGVAGAALPGHALRSCCCGRSSGGWARAGWWWCRTARCTTFRSTRCTMAQAM